MKLNFSTIYLSALILLNGLFNLSGALYLTSKQKKTISSLVEQKGKSLSSLVGSMVINPLLSNDIVKLDNIVKTALKDREVAYLFIADKEGNLLNTFTEALNISGKEFKRMGIKPDNFKISLENLLKNKNIYSVQSPISVKGTTGTIYLGLSKKNFNRTINRSFTIMITITLIVIIFTSLISYMMFNHFVYKPLNKIIRACSTIAAGDLSTNIDIHDKNEIGLVADTMNNMVSNLKTVVLSLKDLLSGLESTAKEADEKSNTISININNQCELIQNIFSSTDASASSLKEISRQTDELRSSSEETSSSLAELVTSSSEITNNMDNLSKEIDTSTSSLQQLSSSLNDLVDVVDIISDAVESTSASTTEIRASIKEIESRADESRKLVTNIRQQTEQTGLVSITKTIEGMKKVKNSVELTGEVISVLDTKSREIGKILQVIDEVTDRTTLLSLNASILAAQAGHHGKSFAVVASEIKNLSIDTSNSTKEISDIINTIRKQIKTAVQGMGQGIEMVVEGLSQAEEAGKIFDDISSNTQNASEYSDRIYRATQEQSEGVNLVANAVHSIDERIGGLLVFTREQKQNMDNIMLSIARMRDIAHEVTNSTREQEKASSEISKSADNVSNMSSAIAIAINVISEKSSKLLSLIEDIRQNARENVITTSEISQSINILLNNASILKETIDRFKA
ncbi:methyl-accepting chemotaxis protein McpA [bacterium BMS3Abin07]|nr:methyl-accepting chemotaxis protein McpA [bacterium BMS3Abin07]GBE31242.1 methyl-accepting chemotaxis protein McpA [bacterium BMS3Bbin05]